MEVKRYPSAAAVAAALALPQGFENANLFSRDQLSGQQPPTVVVSGVVATEVVAGVTLHKFAAAAASNVRALWRFNRSDIAADTLSFSMVIHDGDAGTSGNFCSIAFRDSALAQISLTGPTMPQLAVTTPTTYSATAVAIPANTAYIDVDIQFTAAAGAARNVRLRSMSLRGGSSAAFIEPSLAPLVETNRAQIELVQSGRPAYFGNLSHLPDAIAAALAVGGASLSQDFASGLVTASHPETNEAAASASKTTYYFATNGNNANDGLSRAKPKRSLGQFLSGLTPTTDIEIIIIGAAQIFYRNDSLAGVTWDHPYHLSIAAESEALITSAQPALSWSATGAAWQATRSLVGSVFDSGIRDYRNMPLRLRKVASVTEVQATRGTWYTDGTTVAVRLHDDRTPDAKVLVNLETGTFKATAKSGKTIFLKNIIFAQRTAGLDNVRI